MAEAAATPPSGLAVLREEVNRSLERWLPSEDREPRRLHRAMRYAVLGPGKRLRPVLCLAACEGLGGRREEALPAACALELIHAYSLVHDDLPALDDDRLRRGRPTVHVAFDEATAILVGDALQAEAMSLLLREPGDLPPERQLAVLREVVSAIGTSGMVGGQMDDLLMEGRTLEEAALVSIHERKTGALLRASVRIGAVLAGADGERLLAMGRFGESLGLAFQVVDDLLDVTGTEESLGKSPGKDAASGKTTFASLLGVEGSRRRALDLVERALASLATAGVRGDLLAELAGYVARRTG